MTLGRNDDLESGVTLAFVDLRTQDQTDQSQR